MERPTKFANLFYTKIPIKIFEPANENEIKEAYNLIKNKIDDNFCQENTCWQDI